MSPMNILRPTVRTKILAPALSRPSARLAVSSAIAAGGGSVPAPTGEPATVILFLASPLPASPTPRQNLNIVMDSATAKNPGVKITNAVDLTGAPTGIGLDLVRGLASTITAGLAGTYVPGAFEVGELSSCWYHDSQGYDFKITGLNPAKTYRITTAASRDSTGDGRQSAHYVAAGTAIDSVTKRILVNSNPATGVIANSAVFNVIPNAAGVIEFNISGENANYVYLGGIHIQPLAQNTQPSLVEKTLAIFRKYNALGVKTTWFDFWDSASLYQDAAGSLQLTAPGQPIGYVRDKSDGGVLCSLAQATTAARPLYASDGNLSYAIFDGIDDSFLSAINLDLTGNNKITTVTGLRKASDANIGVIFEHSINVSNNPGSFFLSGPTSPNAADYRWSVRGGPTSNRQNIAVSGMPAPHSAVITGTADIAAATASIRINGVATPLSADLGTGNFGTYPLYVGRREGSFAYNGQLNSMMVINAALLPAEISTLEAYAASKNGVVL